MSAEGRVEHQTLNQTTALLLFGWVFCVQLGSLEKKWLAKNIKPWWVWRNMRMAPKLWNRNFKIFEKAISFIEISVRSFTKFHKISQSFNLRWAEISKENKYKKFNKKFQNSKKPTETSREISWNFDINFTKFQLKFH